MKEIRIVMKRDTYVTDSSGGPVVYRHDLSLWPSGS